MPSGTWPVRTLFPVKWGAWGQVREQLIAVQTCHEGSATRSAVNSLGRRRYPFHVCCAV
jgi:hypothetical protein